MNHNLTDFRTFDLSLASALITEGFIITAIERTQYSNKSNFIFNRTDKLDEIVQAFWADKLSVNPKLYFDALKHLKTRIYSGS